MLLVAGSPEEGARVERGNDLFVDCLGRFPPVEPEELGALQAAEDRRALLERRSLLEVVGPAPVFPDADAPECFLDGNVEQDEQVWLRGEALVDRDDRLGVEAASALVCRRGKVVPIHEHDAAWRQGWSDQCLDMVLPVLEECLELLILAEPPRRLAEPPRRSRLPKALAMGSPRRFLGLDYREARVAKALRQQARLRRLAGPVDPFERHENAATQTDSSRPGLPLQRSRRRITRRRRDGQSPGALLEAP